MKTILNVLTGVYLALFPINLFSQDNGDWIIDSLAGRWYLSEKAGGIAGGGYSPVWFDSDDSVRINRIQGTDSIIWKRFHNCELLYETRYVVVFTYDYLSQSDKWMVKNDFERYIFGYYFLPDKFSLTRQAYDGESNIFSKQDTISLGESPHMTRTTDGTRCGPGSVLLTASANPGSVKWYTSPEGGSPIAYGEYFSTEIIEDTSKFYADASSGSCVTSPRNQIMAIIKPLPVVITNGDSASCEPGTIGLSAFCPEGTIRWYKELSDTLPITTGSGFITPEITETSTYYVDAINNGCSSLEKLAVTAYISYDDTCLSALPVNSQSDNFIVFPNPATDRIVIRYQGSPGSFNNVDLLNIVGKSMINLHTYTPEIPLQIDVSMYPAGIYFIKCSSEKNHSFYKIVKQ